jgi:hypothetical protein
MLGTKSVKDNRLGAIIEYPSTFETMTCYHDTMIRSEITDVIYSKSEQA